MKTNKNGVQKNVVKFRLLRNGIDNHWKFNVYSYYFMRRKKTAAAKAKVKLSDQFGTIPVICDLCGLGRFHCIHAQYLAKQEASFIIFKLNRTFSNKNSTFLAVLMLCPPCYTMFHQRQLV